MMNLLKRQVMRFAVKDIKPAIRGKYLEGRYAKIQDWQSRLAEACKKDVKATVPSVEAFKQYIRENPVAKMYLQGGLDQIPPWVVQYYVDEDQCILQKPRKAISYGLTWEQLLDQFAAVTKTAPKFSDEDIIGVPFYALLIDLLNTEFGRTFFALDDVNTHLKPIFDAYGAFLDSPDSLKYLTTEKDGWLSSPRVKYSNFVCDTSKPNFGFKSWHDWFTREIKEDAFPFDKSAVNTIINNSEHYPNFDMPKTNIQWHDKFWLKDGRYSLAEIFGADALPADQQAYYRNAFENGTIYQGFLNPWCYHRWRSPVSGVVERCYKIGNAYYAGNPSLSL